MEKLPKPNRLQPASKSGQAVVNFDTGVKSSLVVSCSLRPSMATEYLLLIADRTAHAGAKRPFKKSGGKGATGQSASINFDYMKTINGLTKNCLHCSNEAIIQCEHCKAISCATEGKAHVCPTCKTYIEKINIITGSDFSASKKAPPKSISGVLKNTSNHKKITSIGRNIVKK